MSRRNWVQDARALLEMGATMVDAETVGGLLAEVETLRGLLREVEDAYSLQDTPELAMKIDAALGPTEGEKL